MTCPVLTRTRNADRRGQRKYVRVFSVRCEEFVFHMELKRIRQESCHDGDNGEGVAEDGRMGRR